MSRARSHPSGAGAPRGSQPFSSDRGARSRDGSDARIAAQEHLANVSRLRVVHAVAAGLWVLTVLCDWSATTFVTHGPIGWFLLWRAVVFAALCASVARTSLQPPPSPAVLRAVELAVHGTATFAVAMMALRYKGIASPYAHAVSSIIVARAVALPERWQRGLGWGAVPAALYGLTFAAAALVSPGVAEQFRHPELVSEFALGVGLQFVTLVLTVTGGHATWALRRRVFETRAVGRYRLTRKLGAGAMGEVWLAHHPALKRDVAVKLLKGEASDAAVQRFEREVRATADLVHPNTVRVFDYGVTDEGDWFYAMEYVPGETLAAVVHRDGPMAADRVARVAAQAARALGEAHGRGIVHRDIKPENLMLTALGGEVDFVKVLDFGVAKVMSERDTHVTRSLTRDGAVLGTPLFMSPEQGSGDPVDARSDLYSLGCVMYFALCGQAPFDTGNSATTILFHMTREPPSFEERGVAVPDPLRAVVWRCLAKDPADRFPDAAALAAALVSPAHSAP
jgi:serine/threonine-protein kinase